MSGHLRYQPGSAYLAATSGCGVLTPDAATALRLWPLVSRGAPLAALLEEALTDGLAQLPDLILFEVDHQALRVVVRGKIGVEVQTVDGANAQTDGQAVRSWTEQLYSAPLTFGAGEPSADGLPLSGGVVMAGGFQWTVAAPDERRSVPQDVPTASEPFDQGPPSRDEPDGSLARPAALPSAAEAPPLPPQALPSSPQASPSSPKGQPTSAPQLRDTRIEPIDDSFEHLFESTIMRSVEDAAIRAPEDDESFISAVPAAAPQSVPAGSQVAQPDEPIEVRAGDHDGSTIMAGQLASLLASTGDPQARPADPATVAQLSLLLSTGQTISLDRGVVIGRRPQVDRVSGTAIPHLITVPSPQQDISRSHVAIRPTAAGCVAVDLGSTNGSLIRRASGESVDLRDGASIDVQPGDVIDLGDGITAELRGPS